MIGEKTLKRNAISLFSSSGIGDLGLKANDITTIIGCDILPERMNLFQHNYPEAKCFCGNIWDEKKKIIDYYRSIYKEEPIQFFHSSLDFFMCFLTDITTII